MKSCFLGSLGNKAQVGQAGSGVYGASAAPVASQSSGSFSHSAAATSTAPYSTDTAADYSQYSQAYTQVLYTHTETGTSTLHPEQVIKNLPGGCLSAPLLCFPPLSRCFSACSLASPTAADRSHICRRIQTQFQMIITFHFSKQTDLD